MTDIDGSQRAGESGKSEAQEGKDRSNAVRLAIIGLLGTLLTVCGGVGGALISGAVTVYQLERKMQQVSVDSAESEEALSIDTGGIFITRQEAAALDPAAYYVDLDRGLALYRPLRGWGDLEQLTLADQLAETGNVVSDDELGGQVVYRMRYGDPIEVELDRQSTINGHPMGEDMVLALDALYGSAPWTVPYHTQIIVNVFDRDVESQLGIHNLPQAMLWTMRYSSSRLHRLIAPAASDFIVVQGASTFGDVRIDGRTRTIAVEDWFLFAETDESYFVVEIVYTPQSGQSLQVWDDLQAYMDSFRVIR
ncbi:MAG: hypothetical protein GX620_15275 [Chloroflexi bacterium]|nr:hypothetical protein [Chloroflexota bacterium]